MTGYIHKISHLSELQIEKLKGFMSVSKKYATVYMKGVNIQSHKIFNFKKEYNVIHVPFATLESGIGASKGKGYGDTQQIKDVNEFIQQFNNGDQKFELHIANFPRISNKTDKKERKILQIMEQQIRLQFPDSNQLQSQEQSQQLIQQLENIVDNIDNQEALQKLQQQNSQQEQEQDENEQEEFEIAQQFGQINQQIADINQKQKERIYQSDDDDDDDDDDDHSISDMILTRVDNQIKIDTQQNNEDITKQNFTSLILNSNPQLLQNQRQLVINPQQYLKVEDLFSSPISDIDLINQIANYTRVYSHRQNQQKIDILDIIDQKIKIQFIKSQGRNNSSSEFKIYTWDKQIITIKFNNQNQKMIYFFEQLKQLVDIQLICSSGYDKDQLNQHVQSNSLYFLVPEQKEICINSNLEPYKQLIIQDQILQENKIDSENENENEYNYLQNEQNQQNLDNSEMSIEQQEQISESSECEIEEIEEYKVKQDNDLYLEYVQMIKVFNKKKMNKINIEEQQKMEIKFNFGLILPGNSLRLYYKEGLQVFQIDIAQYQMETLKQQTHIFRLIGTENNFKIKYHPQNSIFLAPRQNKIYQIKLVENSDNQNLQLCDKQGYLLANL